MRTIIDDLSNLFGALTLNNIIFFIAITSLVILVVTFIYFIKLNKEEKMIETDEEEIEEEIDESTEELLSDLICSISGEEDKTPSVKEELDVLPRADDEPEVLLDLKALTENIDKVNEKIGIDFDVYEKEQEEKAIISYDELLKSSVASKINYVEEKEDEGLSIKQVDLDNLTSYDESGTIKVPEVKLISYEKEEAFLKALQDLSKILS